jgi:hypothetical protein
MEKLIILRMFFCFPLFGLLLPDAGVFLSSKPDQIPLVHIVIEIFLVFCILLCTAAIAYNKRRNNKAKEVPYFSK